MGLDIDFYQCDEEDPLLSLRGHHFLLELICQQEPALAHDGYSDTIIDARVLGGMEHRLRSEMRGRGIEPATGSPSPDELETSAPSPDASFIELLPYYLQVTRELRRWTDDGTHLVCAVSA